MISPATSPESARNGRISVVAKKKHVPPKRLTPSEIYTISRSFGVPVDDMVDTAKRVEEKRCEVCGDLSCLHTKRY